MREKISCMKSLIHIITVGCRRHGTCGCNNVIMILLTIKSKKIEEKEEILYFVFGLYSLICLINQSSNQLEDHFSSISFIL